MNVLYIFLICSYKWCPNFCTHILLVMLHNLYYIQMSCFCYFPLIWFCYQKTVHQNSYFVINLSLIIVPWAINKIAWTMSIIKINVKIYLMKSNKKSNFCWPNTLTLFSHFKIGFTLTLVIWLCCIDHIPALCPPPLPTSLMNITHRLIALCSWRLY